MPEKFSWKKEFIWAIFKRISRNTSLARWLKKEGDDKDQGNDRKRDQGELPVEMKQKDDDPDQQKNVFEKVNENRSKHLVDILDIVGQSGHQSSHRILIKKGDRKILEMGEDLHPEVMHHPLACHLHGIDLREIQSKIDDQNEERRGGRCGKLPSTSLPLRTRRSSLFNSFMRSKEMNQ